MTTTEYGLLPDLDRSDIPDIIDKELKTPIGGDRAAVTRYQEEGEKAEEKKTKRLGSESQ